MQKIQKRLSFIILILISISSYSQNNLGNLNGTWTGQGYQFDLNETWSIILKIDNEKYKIEYPSLHCSADLQFIKNENGKIYLREKIISGDCISNGILILEKSNENKLLFKWTYSDGKPGSTAELLKFY
jgi:hypothetical protein